MSWQFYETLTLQPDFTNPTGRGVYDERDTVFFSEARGFTAWADRSDRIIRLNFHTFTPTEWRILREFFDRHGGRAKAFFLPSWERDFELASDAAAGTNVIAVKGHWHSDNVTEDRPDTIGRRLLIVNHLGQVSTHWVVGVGAAGANDNLVMDRPIPNALEAGRTVVAICYLSRLAEDTIESVHLTPTHATFEATFREITHRRKLNQQESAAGTAVNTLQPAFDVVATDEDPLYVDPRLSTSAGPFLYGISQAEHFQDQWTAELEVSTNLVTVRGAGGQEIVTTLYNAPAPATQIALCFDAASREVLAWELDGRITIGRIVGGDPVRVNFEGYAPCAFNTFAIDSTATAGTATVAVFYLKRGDNTIYCRTMAESFATERRYCISPLAPIWLHAARREAGRIELVGMDSAHRRAIWRSQTYLTPLELQIGTTRVDSVEGLYRLLAVVIGGEDSGTTRIEGVGGEYRNIRVFTSVMEESQPVGKVGNLVTGAYTPIRVQYFAEEPGGTGRLATTVSGEYNRVRIDSTAEDGNRAEISNITGTYG